MTKLKTQPNDRSVDQFLQAIENDQKRQDSREIVALMAQVTGETAQMWGDSIVGFGRYRYRYASGREGEWPLVGFSPRKQNLTLYIMAGFDHYDELLERLGKYSTGKSCLYVKKLEDVDRAVLEALVRASVEHMQKTNP